MDNQQNGTFTDSRRRYPGEIEVGFTDVLRKHPTVHLAADHAPPIPAWILAFERRRPGLLRECIAEATGVFCYVYGGVSVLATFILTSAAKEANFGSLLNVAFGFAFGIAMALIVAAGTSGGHFNPAMTLVFATYQGFPWRKVPFYILSQCFGSFMACAVIYAQWHQQIKSYETALRALGAPMISATGPAGIFCAIPNAGQSNGYLFLVEFFADSFIGMIIWAVLDPNTQFISPASAPFVIGLAYFLMILGYGANTLSTNTARDFGARAFSAILYGRGVFTVNGGYAAISLLVNIPATFFGVTFYQLVFGDATRLIATGKALPTEVHRVLTEERAKNGGEPGEFETYLRKAPTARSEMVNGSIMDHQAKV